MARKVFISILGTGYYNRTKYYWEEKDDYVETRFVQEASLKLLTKYWTKNDYAYFFLTKAAKQINWISPAQSKDIRVKDGERDTYKGLDERIKGCGLPYSYAYKNIPDGNNEREIWGIFETVFNVLKEGDEVYFDITHAFRSLPMLVMVLINYAKYLKSIKVKKIIYGNWEGRDKETNLAPIIDLTSFTELQDWTSAAISFTKFGRVGDVIELIKTKNDSIELYDFSNDIISNRGLEILSAQKIVDLRKQLGKYDVDIAPFNEIRNTIFSKLSHYKQNNTINGFIAVDFCLENGLIQQGITLLQEFIVTKVLNDIGICKFDEIKSKNYRHVITATLQRKNISEVKVELFLTGNDKKSKTKSKRKTEKYTKWVDAVFKLPYKDELTKDIFIELSDKIRNDINHAGFRPEPLNSNDFEVFLKEKQRKTKSLFNIN